MLTFQCPFMPQMGHGSKGSLGFRHEQAQWPSLPHLKQGLGAFLSLLVDGVLKPCSSVQFSLSVMSVSLRPHESQHARPPCSSPNPGVYSNACPLSRWYHPAISFSIVPFSSWPQCSQHQGLFQWVNTSHEVAKVLEFQLQHQSFQWTTRT